MEGIVSSKSKTFFFFCLSFLLGVVIISLVDYRIPLGYCYTAFFILISLLILHWDHTGARFVLLCVFISLLGVVRYLIAFPLPRGHHIVTDAGAKKTLTGYVSSEPDVRSDGVRYIVKITDSDVRGTVYTKMNLYPRYAYGDVLRLHCDLQRPEVFDDFRYDMYLARYGVFVVCDKVHAEKIGEGKGNMVMSGLLKFKRVIAEQIAGLWHEPQASFVAGLLYGYRGGLGELNTLFSRTGVTHIVAVSGQNIVIIATIMATVFIQWLCIRRQKAFYCIVAGIILFVLFTGASGSVVRAGVMGIVALLSKQIGRLSRIENILVFTATIMIAFNPFLLFWDAGFQLSFLSTLGLVYVSPMVEKWFTRFPETFGIQETLVATFAAIIATLPLILYQFGRLSLVAPLVNVLILWIIPWVMLFGAVSVASSFLFHPLGVLISWVTGAGLGYIILVVKFFSSLPFAAIDLTIPWWGMALLYVLLGYWVIQHIRLERFERLQRLSIYEKT